MLVALNSICVHLESGGHSFPLMEFKIQLLEWKKWFAKMCGHIFKCRSIYRRIPMAQIKKNIFENTSSASASVSLIRNGKIGCCVFRTNVSPHLQSNNLLRWHAKRTTSAKIAKRNRIVDWLCVCTTQRWRQHNGIFFSILHHYTWKMAKPTRGFSTIHYTVYKCMYYWIGSLHFVSRFTQKWYTLLSRRR